MVHSGVLRLLGTAALTATLLVAGSPALSRADETSLGGTVARTNWDAAEPGLTAGEVTQHDFGTLFDTTLPRPTGQTATSFPNQVYAQPLVADGRVIVATEENQVDALDPVTGAVEWSVSLGPAWTPTPTCGDLLPHIGVTSTPVYDPTTERLYVVAKTADGVDAAHPNLRMHALDVDDGHEVSGWPLSIAGAATNSGEYLNPATANQRPGLLVLGGSVYFATASHCDHGPYVGFVGGITTAGTPHLTLWSSETAGASSGAGIWQSGGGLMSDGPGRIFLATGNGVSPAPGPGTTPPGTLAESVVRLGVNTDGTMTARDFFSPANNAKLDQDDADLGSGSPVALPDSFGTAGHPHLLVIAGKDGVVRLLDRDALGGSAQAAGGTDAVVSSVQLSGVWGHAAVFASGSNHYLYLLPSNAPLRVLRVAPNVAGVPTLSPVSSSAQSFAYSSGSPIVTSDGDDASGALVWVVTCSGSSGADGTLQAFPAVPPTSGAWNPVASFPLGTVAKFIQPATDGGRIYVGTRDGRVLAFGRPTSAAVSAPSTDFGLQPVGSTTNVDVTITATQPVTITTVAASGPFAVNDTSPALPAALGTGQTLTASVAFSPSGAGAASGVLTVQAGDDEGDEPATYSFGLNGTGTAPGLSAQPGSVGFGEVPVGSSAQLGVTIRNTGTADTTVTGIDAPAAPFAADSLPGPGFVIPAQQSITIAARVSPTSAGPLADALTVHTDSGSVTVPLTATATAGAPHLALRSSLDFGNVAPGKTRTLGLTVSNTGTAALTITKAAPPSAPFQVAAPLAEGQRLEPGDALAIQIDLAPLSGRPITNTYVISSDDGQGAHAVVLTANTAPWTGPVPAPLGCLDILSNTRAKGTPAVSYPCNGTAAQQFTKGSYGSLRLGPATSRWCLDVVRAGTAAGSPVQLWTCNATAAQQWAWDTTGRLVNPHAHRCLDVSGHSGARNARLVLETCSTTPSQKWDPSALLATRGITSSGLAAFGQICLTDPRGDARPGTPVTIDTCSVGSAAQIVTHSLATLRVAGQCLTVASSTPVAGTAVWLEPCNGSAPQLWTPGSSGSLISSAGRLCLDVPRSSTTPGTTVQVWRCNGTLAQKWTLPG
jgi:Ricin-type beta-trefoil lectin domain/Abnormal spindle-like microcephaly-assoc'd, ASPM-SPD-2-Hydin/PQQ-like domain